MIDPNATVTVTAGELEDLIAYASTNDRAAVVDTVYRREGLR